MVIVVVVVVVSRRNRRLPIWEIGSLEKGGKKSLARSEFLRRKLNHRWQTFSLVKSPVFVALLLPFLFRFFFQPSLSLAGRFPSPALCLAPCPFGSANELLWAHSDKIKS